MMISFQEIEDPIDRLVVLDMNVLNDVCFSKLDSGAGMPVLKDVVPHLEVLTLFIPYELWQLSHLQGNHLVWGQACLNGCLCRGEKRRKKKKIFKNY